MGILLKATWANRYRLFGRGKRSLSIWVRSSTWAERVGAATRAVTSRFSTILQRDAGSVRRTLFSLRSRSFRQSVLIFRIVTLQRQSIIYSLAAGVALSISGNLPGNLAI